jgi:copper(I)-binding protein
MPRFITLFSTIFLMATACVASPIKDAENAQKGKGWLTVTDAWARAGKPNSAAFMKIRNASGEDLQIVSAKADVTTKVELHDHLKEGDVMKMRKIESIKIPAGGEVELMPGGKHVMLLDLGMGLEEGKNIELTLILSNGSEITIEVPIKEMTYNPKLETGCSACQH